MVLRKITFLNYFGEGAKRQHEPFNTYYVQESFFFIFVYISLCMRCFEDPDNAWENNEHRDIII